MINFKVLQVTLFVAFLVIVADIATKQMILEAFAPGEMKEIIPGFFNLVLVFNPGAAFGMFATLPDPYREIILYSTALLAIVFLFYLLFSEYKESRIGQVAIGLILGGAVGNKIDRLTQGKVTDFLDFYIGSYHWPAFNVADSAICCGVAVMLFAMIKSSKIG
jgi:signal peptidase II